MTGRAAPLAASLLVLVLVLALGLVPAPAARGETAAGENGPGATTLGEIALGSAMRADAGTVTFEEVLRNPSDYDLGMRYAEGQIRRGRLKGAAATLERVLLARPGDPRARVLHAVVLYRLGADAEAERALMALDDIAMTPDARAEIRSYLAAIAKRRETTRLAGSLAFGVQGDSNRAAAADGARATAVDLPRAATGRRADAALLGILNLRLAHDPGFQERHEVFVETSALADRQLHLSRQSFENVTGATGATLDLAPWTLLVAGTVEHLAMQGETYLLMAGPRLRATLRVDEHLDLHAETRHRRQDFHDVLATVDGEALAPSASARSGGRSDLEIGASWVPDPAHRLSIAVSGVAKTAKAPREAFSGGDVSLGHVWLLGEGQFLSTSADIGLEIHDAPDPRLSGRTRRDLDYGGRVTWGGPLGFLADTSFALSAEARRTDSTVPDYSYGNLRGQLLLVRRFAF